MIAIEDAMGGLACTGRALWGVCDKLREELKPVALHNDDAKDGGR